MVVTTVVDCMGISILVSLVVTPPEISSFVERNIDLLKICSNCLSNLSINTSCLIMIDECVPRKSYARPLNSFCLVLVCNAVPQ